MRTSLLIDIAKKQAEIEAKTQTAEVSQLSDEEALEGIQEVIAYAAQDEWLATQFQNRTPFPRREKIDSVAKDGHPYLFQSNDINDVKAILNGDRNFARDLNRIKIIFAEDFEQDTSYFSYLDSLSEEDFYAWLGLVSVNIYENNSHWAKFAAKLLNYNDIDPSDLVEGKLDKDSVDRLIQIQKALRRLQELTDGTELRSAIVELQQLGITQVMIKAHEEWRKTFYGLDSINPTDSGYKFEQLEYQYIVAINNLIGSFAKDQSLTVDEMMARVKSFRRDIESDAKVNSNQTFGILVSLAKITDFAQKYSQGISEEHLSRLKDLEARLTKIVALDANPAPIDTVVTIYNKAKGLEA